MSVIGEFKKHNFRAYLDEPIINCDKFEGRSWALYMTLLTKIQPKSKNIHCVYHHFWENTKKVFIHIFLIK